MKLEKSEIEFVKAMARLCQEPNNQRFFVEQAGIDSSLYSFYSGNSSFSIWYRVVSDAKLINKFPKLIDTVLERYPELIEANILKEEHSNLSKREKKYTWHAPVINLEKLIEKQNTILPISFLHEGLKVSKAVCKIKVKKNSKVAFGTGFLLNEDLLVTNNHVISNIDEAKNEETEVIFNYEKLNDGNVSEFEVFKLEPELFFKTSRKEELDITIVKVNGQPCRKYGYLDISNTSPQKEDYVNIIQHPEGGFKKIAMYHNVVVYSDDKIIQYLTDTLNGSSGSPVFNSNWEVVAVHHAGGYLSDPLTDKLYFRNQGINAKNIFNLLC